MWRRTDVLLAAVAVVVSLGCGRLGIWQLDRLAQRKERNAALAARLALPPIDLNELAQPLVPDSLSGRRVTARGAYDYGREWLWRGRSFQGTPGVGLITPLRLSADVSVFVDRGWVPSPDAYTVSWEDQRRYRERDPDAVTGIALRPPRGRGDIEIPADGFIPVIVQLEEPVAPSGLPRRWPAPSLDNGPHLSYAIQWFSFGLIVLVGTAALLRKSTRAGELSP